VDAPAFQVDGVEIVYCEAAAEAEALIREMIADAAGAPVALDLEAAPNSMERAKLEALLEERQAAMARKTAAGRESRKTGVEALRAEALALEARLKRLDKQIERAKAAGLDPRKGAIRLGQLYGGGRRAAVLDVAKAGARALAALNGASVIIHNAVFDCGFLNCAGVELGEVHDTLQWAKLGIGDS
jgi:hypothetical protein